MRQQRHWRDWEEEQLRAWFAAGWGDARVARALRRSPKAVAVRRHALGLLRR